MDGARAITTKGKLQRKTRRIGNHVRTTTKRSTDNGQRTTDNGQRMFTGIILHSATIDGLETLRDGARLRRRTTLGGARAGERVNLEFDMMAKYVRNLVAPYLAGMRPV